MINENTTFKQYLKESGYSLMQYQEEVYHTCLAKSSKYKNIDLYFQDEIEQGFNDNTSIEDTANTICEKFDDFFDKTNVEEDEEYTPEQLQAFADYPQDSFDEDMNESTDDGMSDGESYTQWKEYVFKYLDKRIETDKIKELGTYIKDFIKQEYDNGEPSWFNVAESVVNYARTNYPQAVKPRESNAFSITENRKNEAFIQDDRGTVNIDELKTAILKKADLIYDDGDPKGEIAKYNLSDAFVVIGAANYIAAFYAKQSMPKNGMIAWGVRDIKSFVNRFNNGGADAAIRGTRSVLVGKPPKDLENQYIERVKAAIRKQNADAEEKRRQAYLNSEEHRHMQDPGWRGPRGTWSND